MERPSRRDLLKRGAIAGVAIGAIPVIQTFDVPAFGQAGSPQVEDTQVETNPVAAPAEAKKDPVQVQDARAALPRTGLEVLELAATGAGVAAVGASMVKATAGRASTSGLRLDAAAAAAAGVGELSGIIWAYQSPRLCALGHPFGVRATDAALGRHLSTLLAPWHPPSGALGAAAAGEVEWYSLRQNGDTSRYSIYRGDDVVATAYGPAFALSTLIGAIDRGNVARAADDHLLLHASAASDADTVAVFVGPSGAGKTTLVAALVRDGLGYVADEIVAIDPDSLEIAPYQKVISLEEGSRDLFPELQPKQQSRKESRTGYIGPKWHVPATNIRPDALDVATRPGFVFDIHYRPDEPTTVEPMSVADTITTLVENSFNGDQLGGQRFAAAVALARRAQGYRLRFASVDEASEIVRGTLLVGSPVGE